MLAGMYASGVSKMLSSPGFLPGSLLTDWGHKNGISPASIYPGL